MSANEDLTVRQRYKKALVAYHAIDRSDQRQDSAAYQKALTAVIRELETLERVVESLALFSSNEELREINTAYLPFVLVPFYHASLLMKSTCNADGTFPEEMLRRLNNKAENLAAAVSKFALFIDVVRGFGGVLTPTEENRIQLFKNPNRPTYEEIEASAGDAAMRRAQKISYFKEERTLEQKLLALERDEDEKEDDTDILAGMDEDVVRQVYIDKIRLQVIRAFALLEGLAMEQRVLQNRPQAAEIQTDDTRAAKKLEPFDYTAKVERDPMQPTRVSELLSKQGRVKQPFVLTNQREDLRKQVFGTGQVLPSMSVEEYLDYELANGKMAAAEQPRDDSESDIDSDEEVRQRHWDDWKDDNPKGSGNMKANLG